MKLYAEKSELVGKTNRQLIFRTGGKVTKCRVKKNPEIRRKSGESEGIIAIRILDILAFTHLLHSGLHPDCTLAYLRESVHSDA